MAKTIEISQKTTLSPDQARQAIDNVVADLAGKYTLSAGWQDKTTFLITGQGIVGSLKICDGSVDVRITISGVLCHFAQLIKDQVQQKLNTYISS